MAYFDSPKNRAIWEKEIARLETEREKRKQKELNDSDDEIEENMEEKPAVREISFKELEMIVRSYKANAAIKTEKEPTRSGKLVNERTVTERDIRRKPEVQRIL